MSMVSRLNLSSTAMKRSFLLNSEKSIEPKFSSKEEENKFFYNLQKQSSRSRERPEQKKKHIKKYMLARKISSTNEENTSNLDNQKNQLQPQQQNQNQQNKSHTSSFLNPNINTHTSNMFSSRHITEENTPQQTPQNNQKKRNNNLQEKSKYQQQNQQQTNLKSLDLHAEKKITFRDLINAIKLKKKEQRKNKKTKFMPIKNSQNAIIKNASIFKQLIDTNLKQMNLGPITDKRGQLVKHSLIGDTDTFLAIKEAKEQQDQQKKASSGQKVTGLFKQRLVDASAVTPSQRQSNVLSKDPKDSLTSLLMQYQKIQEQKNQQNEEEEDIYSHFAHKAEKIKGIKNNSRAPIFKYDPQKMEYLTKEDILKHVEKLEEQRKQIEQIELEYIKQLPAELQNIEYKQEKILVKHDQMVAEWIHQQEILKEKVRRKYHQPTLFQQSEQFRKKIETIEAIEKLKPIQDKLGPERSWNLTLRQYKENRKDFKLVTLKKKDSVLHYLDAPDKQPLSDINIKDKGYSSVYHLDYDKELEFIQRPSISNTLQDQTSTSTLNSISQSQTMSKGKNHLWKRYSQIHQSNDAPKNIRFNSQLSQTIIEDTLPLATTILNGEVDDELAVKGKNKLMLEAEEIKNDGRPMQSIYKKKKNKSELPVFTDLIKQPEENDQLMQNQITEMTNSTFYPQISVQNGQQSTQSIFLRQTDRNNNNNNNQNFSSFNSKSNNISPNKNYMTLQQKTQHLSSIKPQNSKTLLRNTRTQFSPNKQQLVNKTSNISPLKNRVTTESGFLSRKITPQHKRLNSFQGNSDSLLNYGEFDYRNTKFDRYGEIIEENYDNALAYNSKIQNQKKNYLNKVLQTRIEQWKQEEELNNENSSVAK